MIEEWKIFKDLRPKGNVWEVSSYGRIKKNNILYELPKPLHYIQVAGDYLHRIVFRTFISEIPKGYEIDHIDGNKLNNNINNLRLVTHKENYENPITLQKIKETHNDIWSRIEHPKKGKHGYPSWNKGLTKYTDNRIKKISNSRLGIEPWNKGLTKDTDERVRNTYKKNKCL